MLRAEPLSIPQETDAVLVDPRIALRERRRSLGIYYTPQNAADILAGWAIRDGGDTVLEPSFGGCSLLEAASSRLSALQAGSPSGQLFGYDVDAAAFAHLSDLLGNFQIQNSFVKQDFLSVSPGELQVDAVIANPPFVSYHRMSHDQRRSVLQWRSTYGSGFPLTASLWAYFLIHGMAFLREGGRMAFVLPSAAVRSDYAAAVLKKITEKFSEVQIFRVQEQLFLQEGAEERPVVLLADGYQQGQSRQPRVLPVENLADLRTALEMRSSATIEDQIDGASHSLVCKLREEGNLQSIGDLASVSIGEVVGDTKFFVKSYGEWQELGIPPKNLRPLLTRSSQVLGKLRVSNSDVEGHSLPHLLLPLSPLRSSKVKDYLATYPTAKRDLNVTFGKRPVWHSASYDTSADAFLPSLSHESPRVILNSAEVSCANGFYKLHSRAGVPWRATVAAASLTTVFRWSAEVQGRPMGAGAMKLEPSDVRQLLVPSSLHELTAHAAATLLRDLDSLLRDGLASRATDLADRVLLVESKILTEDELERLRAAVRLGQERRMQRAPITQT